MTSVSGEELRVRVARAIAERVTSATVITRDVKAVSLDAADAVLALLAEEALTQPDQVDRVELLHRIIEDLKAIPRVPESMTPEALNIAADLLDDMRTRICAAVGAEDTGGRYSQLLRGWAREIGTPRVSEGPEGTP